MLESAKNKGDVLKPSREWEVGQQLAEVSEQGLGTQGSWGEEGEG